MPKSALELEIESFKNKLNANYKGEVASRGPMMKSFNIARFSSGILDLDIKLGGGWPFSRIITLAGNYSSGKTLKALKAAEQVEKYCHNCRQFGGIIREGAMRMSRCKCGDFVPGAVLFVDAEGAFDLAWAKVNGWNADWHTVIRPETAEQSIDIINAAIRENLFDLIILDSVAALTPTTEIVESTESWQMGLAARLINKAMRTWCASLIKMSQQNPIKGGPTLMCLNQLRQNMVPRGDNRVLPGGKGQEFASSVIIYTKPNHVEDDAAKETAYANLQGVTKKNKTYVPSLEYECTVALKDIIEGDTVVMRKGEVNNPEQLVKKGKEFGVIKKIGGGIGHGVVAVSTEKVLQAELRKKPEFARAVWIDIIKASCDIEFN